MKGNVGENARSSFRSMRKSLIAEVFFATSRFCRTIGRRVRGRHGGSRTWLGGCLVRRLRMCKHYGMVMTRRRWSDSVDGIPQAIIRGMATATLVYGM